MLSCRRLGSYNTPMQRFAVGSTFQTLGCHCRDLSGEKSSAQRLLLTTHRILSTMLIYIVFYKILYYRSIMIYMYIIVYIYIFIILYYIVLTCIQLYHTELVLLEPKPHHVQVEFKTLVRELHRNGIEVWQAGSCSKLVCRCETALLVLVQGLYELIFILVLLYMIISDYIWL